MRRLDAPTLLGRHVRLEPLAPEHAEALVVAAGESRAPYDARGVNGDQSDSCAPGSRAVYIFQ